MTSKSLLELLQEYESFCRGCRRLVKSGDHCWEKHFDTFHPEIDWRNDCPDWEEWFESFPLAGMEELQKNGRMPYD